MADEYIIGFDARKMNAEAKLTWNDSRRTLYLLKEDIDNVFSVDYMVWPSVFLTIWPAPSIEYEGPELPKWIGPNNPFWEDLSCLREELLFVSAELKTPYAIIAVSHIRGIDTEGWTKSPSVPAKEWKLLGYDICSGTLSGLSNCGYLPKDAPLKLEWRERVNECHLFDTFDAADDFRKVTDKRVKEHAPFSVYGIYLIKAINVPADLEESV